jgi:serine/threonine protein phosphatase PrpC
MTMIRPRAVDVHRLDLSPEQGFVLSRLEGPLSMSDLASVSGIEVARLVDIVAHLVKQGAVEIETASGTTTWVAPPMHSECPPFGAIDELAAVAETVPSKVPPALGLAVMLRGVSDVGAVRPNNEDALSVVDLTTKRDLNVLENETGLTVGHAGVLLSVSDGMGGENAGEVASALVLTSIRDHLVARSSTEDVATSLAAAIHFASARVAEAAAEPGRSGMGATVVAVIISGATAVTAEVGDSRLYVLRRGVLTQISKDQTHAQVLIDQGLLTPVIVSRSRAKNIVLQACGRAQNLVVAQRRLALRNGDRLLLCSDGLSLHVGNAEIETVLKTATSSEQACATLVSMANARGGEDNVTVLLADVAGAVAQPGIADTVDSTLEVLREFTVGDAER